MANTPNNRRRRDSQHRIESAFVNMLQTKEIGEVTVSEICREAQVNRSTFYANYTDVFDLARRIGDKLAADVEELYARERETGQHDFDFLKLVQNIYDNRLFYRTYFKLELDNVRLISDYEYDVRFAAALYNNQHVDYHIQFFMAGFNAMVKKWLMEDCPFPPEEFIEILNTEYRKDFSVLFG